MFSFFIYSKYTLKVFVLQHLNYNCYSFCIKFVIIYGSQYKQKVHQLSQAGAPYNQNKYNYEKCKKCYYNIYEYKNLELCIGFGPMITVLRTIALTSWPTQQVGQTRFELVTYCL